MTYRCPYTELCRAEAIKNFAAVPELAAIFTERLQCTERVPERAHRCAERLKLTEKELPTFGKYIQDERRSLSVGQADFADTIEMPIQSLRDLELNKLDPTGLPRRVLERIATVLAAPTDYLVMLAKLSSRAGLPRGGVVFARTVLVDDETREPER